MTSRHLTCVSCQCCSWDDGFILAEVWALPHIVFEGAFRLVAMQGSGVVFWVKAVIWRNPLQAAEWRLTAPWLGQSVTALIALNALKGVLAAEFTWDERMGGKGKSTKGNAQVNRSPVWLLVQNMLIEQWIIHPKKADREIKLQSSKLWFVNLKAHHN